MRTVVFSAVLGEFPDVVRPVAAPPGPDTLFVLFADLLDRPPDGWQLRRPLYEHRDPRRAARWHKINAHRSLAEFAPAFSLWHDGSHTLTADPQTLLDRHLPGGVDFAAFRHPERTCVYEELAACRKLKKDDPAVMTAQAARYRAEGYPAHAGLFETACVLRRHTPAVAAFEDLWWAQVAGGSVRDQLSVNYAAARAGLKTGVVPGHRSQSPYFRFVAHR